jgi:tetratricopeptide (TPR) repeat protein
VLWEDKAELKGHVGRMKVGDLSPSLATALGMMLHGPEGYGVPFLKEVQRLHPNDLLLALVLGETLQVAGKPNEAIGYFRIVVALRPQMSAGWNDLGVALAATGQWDEAVENYKKAIKLDLKDSKAHYNLGNALAQQGNLDEAIEQYEKAIEFNPGDSKAHDNLGNVLRKRGRLDEAIKHHKRAVALAPKDPVHHFNLGTALVARQLVGEAIAEFEEAVKLDPKLADAYISLGHALRQKGQVDRALSAYHQAVAADPKLARAHLALGMALFQQMGRFAEAIQALRNGLQLLPEGDPLRPGAMQAIGNCQQFLAVEQKLPAILKGDPRPAGPIERLLLARLCQNYKDLYYAGARFYAGLLEPSPTTVLVPAIGQAGGPTALWPVGWTALGMLQSGRLYGTDDPTNHLRYDAARCAALAGNGKGKDAASLDGKERARLRQQACNWLREDLAIWTKWATRDAKARAQVQVTLLRWQTDADLAGIRDAIALAKLPDPERAAWTKLWQDVESLVAKVSDRK